MELLYQLSYNGSTLFVAQLDYPNNKKSATSIFFCHSCEGRNPSVYFKKEQDGSPLSRG